MSGAQIPPPPLQGVTVVELTHLIAGPYCTQLMADEGAQVIKVEPPGGELTRHREPFRESAQGRISGYFGALNRGKRSIVIDLKNASGQTVLEGLLERADVFVTNMRAAALERLGIHPEALRERFPRLIVVSISGFGIQDAGQNADRAGLAMVAEAMSGTTGLTRDHSGNPVWCGFAMGDILAGMTAHAAILLALRHQERHGVGRLLDIGMVECSLPMVSVAMAREQSASAELRAFAGSNNFHGVPYGAFPALDGHVNIGVNRDDFWGRLCEAMGRPELGVDPRYATYVERAKRQQEVFEITESFTRRHTRAQLESLLGQADVPVASILSMAELTQDAYLRDRGAFRAVEDGIGGTMLLPADPTRFEPAPGSQRVPLLDQHRAEVLQDVLGLDAAAAERLERCGAFGARTA